MHILFLALIVLIFLVLPLFAIGIHIWHQVRQLINGAEVIESRIRGNFSYYGRKTAMCIVALEIIGIIILAYFLTIKVIALVAVANFRQ